jgi:acetylglutamate kinase
MTSPLVLKAGGELLESASQRRQLAAFALRAAGGRPLVVVHGGGRAIDVELERRRIAPRKVDGLRVTDEPTLDAVVAVLAGSANTALVAAFVGAGAPAVGLTGVDAGFSRAVRTAAHVAASGATVDLGFVGDPAAPDPTLLHLLLSHGYVPVIASLGIDAEAGQDTTLGVLNVNADVMACRIAAALDHSELAIAGGTAGVLDGDGRTMPALDAAGIDAAITTGTATTGMIAKLTACRAALDGGVRRIRIVDGRALEAAHRIDDLPGTSLVPAGSAVAAR